MNNVVAARVVVPAAAAVAAQYCHSSAAALSHPSLLVGWEIAFSADLVVDMTTYAADIRSTVPVGFGPRPADERSPWSPPMDIVRPVHWSVHPSRPNRPIRQDRVGRPLSTCCRSMSDTMDIAAVAADAMDGVVAGVHSCRAGPLAAVLLPRLLPHRICSMHRCTDASTTNYLS